MVALWQAIRRDLTAFRQRIAPLRPEPGLYTYRFTPPAGTRRVHLRVEPDRRGVLFVDVTDVVHLNPTAAEMAKWALDGVPLRDAAALLSGRYGRGTDPQWTGDLSAMFALVQRLANPAAGCPTCALHEVHRPPLFSTPVHAPFKADLAITYDCNNDCPHCYNEADRLRLGLLPPEDWKRIIDRLVDAGVPHLIFTGGEATLYAELAEIIHHADQRGPVCGLNTNGRRLAHRSFVNELQSAGLNHVQVTLGSHRADIHDRMMNARCFAQTIRGLENALASGMHAITNTTLTRMNADEIERTIEFLHDLGIRTFAVNGMIYSGGGFDTGQAIPEQEMAAHLIRIRDRGRELGMKFLWYTPTQYCRLSPVELDIGAKRCNAGEYSLCVEPNGDVLPCQSYYTSAGNLLRDPWETIWRSELFVSFREREADPQAHGLPEMCWECPELSLCGGGCRIEREAAQGVRTADSGCATGGCGAQGFVAIESLQPITQRRGSGVFADVGGAKTSSAPPLGAEGRVRGKESSPHTPCAGR